MNAVLAHNFSEKVSIKSLNEKKDLIKNTVAKGCSDSEFELFVHACARFGLDPLMRQIYAIPRRNWNSNKNCYEESMTIQTGIDGYRLIAERSGKYAPGKAPEFRYDEHGQMISSTAFVKKQTIDGTWHEISCEAFYDEYVARKKDGKPANMWTKPHIMLSKCAEALALRKAFPAELSGLLTREEMEQADNESEIEVLPSQIETSKINDKISKEERENLSKMLTTLNISKREAFFNRFKITKIADLKASDYETAYKRLKLTIEANYAYN